MALPTAPLGQLANLNMPYSIPRYEVRRGRDQVLTALAATVAQALGQKVIENAMSRDYAETAGVGENAGFWSRLVQGPTMNRQQFEQANQRAFGREQADLERTQRANIADTEAGIANRRIDVGTAQSIAERELQERLAQERLGAEERRFMTNLAEGRRMSERESANRLTAIEKQGEVSGRLASQARAAEEAWQLRKMYEEYQDAVNLLQERARIEGTTPEGRMRVAQAANQELVNEDMRRRLGGGQQAPGRDGTVDAARRFLEGRNAPPSPFVQDLQSRFTTPPAAGPAPQSDIDILQSMLAPSPEQVMGEQNPLFTDPRGVITPPGIPQVSPQEYSILQGLMNLRGR